MKANHPLIVASLNRRQSATSLTKLLRDPLGYLWTYGFQWKEADETEEPLQLEALAIGGILHSTLERAVSGLELAKPGGFGTADGASIAAAVGKALDSVAREWERTRPVPPPVIWERKLQDIRTLAVAALEYREQSLPGQQSWAYAVASVMHAAGLSYADSIDVVATADSLGYHQGRVDRSLHRSQPSFQESPLA